MKVLGGAMAVAALGLASCGDDGGGDGVAAEGNSFCTGAEQFDAAYEQVSEIFSGVLTGVDEAGGDLSAQLAEDLRAAASEAVEVADDVDEALDTMIAGADDDQRTGLEFYQELSRAQFDLLASLASVEDVSPESLEDLVARAADIEALVDEHPDGPSMVLMIGDATQEQCDVVFPRDAFGREVPEGSGVNIEEESSTADDDKPWPDVDPCSLLPAEALTAAGIENTDGEPGTDETYSASCRWGNASNNVDVRLSGPVRETTTRSDELYGQIAGRDTYVDDDPDFCWLTVDNGDYSLKVNRTNLTESQASENITLCEATEPLAEAALSALE